MVTIVKNAEWSQIAGDYIKNSIPRLEGIYDDFNVIYDIMRSGIHGDQFRCMLRISGSFMATEQRLFYHRYDVLSVYHNKMDHIALNYCGFNYVTAIPTAHCDELDKVLTESNIIPDYEENLYPDELCSDDTNDFIPSNYIKWSPHKPFVYGVDGIIGNKDSDDVYVDCIITGGYYLYKNRSVKFEHKDTLTGKISYVLAQHHWYNIWKSSFS